MQTSAVYVAALLTIVAGRLSPSDVRLAGGPVPYAGRVEVFYNGSWGTVCDDYFDNNDATVVCRMLGYGANTSQAYTFAAFGRGNGTIVIDDLKCLGNETNLSECPSRSWLTNNCRHVEDAGVDCMKGRLSPSDVRLVGGPVPYAGRVEVFYNGNWGTVCDNSLDNNFATVVCRMLGYGAKHAFSTSHTYLYAAFGQGNGTIVIDDLRCRGNETDLSECQSSPWLTGKCHHREDAGVDCMEGYSYCSRTISQPVVHLSVTVTVRLSPADVRLVGGPVPYAGRVEVFYNGNWGTVCGDSFSNNDATVVCRMVGYGANTSQAYGSSIFGRGNGTIVIDYLQCRGTETDLSECPSSPWLTSDCHHSEDAGVDCMKASLSSADIRLSNGSSPHSGRVEVFVNGSWGTICDDSFDSTDAIVICRILGYHAEHVHSFTPARFGAGTGHVVISNLQCSGVEMTLSECSSYYNPWLRHADHCGHSRDAGVDCQWRLSPADVRLVGGPGPYAGRVEVFYNGNWGTVCDDSFNNDDATVVCRMLGYGANTSKAYSFAAFGPGNGTIVIDDLQCLGNETDLSECPSSTWLTSDCRHSEDAGVDCMKVRLSPADVRLVGGPVPYAGRVEVFYNGIWGTVCDHSFDNGDATVVCRMLGYGANTSQAYSSTAFGRGNGTIVIDDLQCRGNETELSECPSSPWLTSNCRHGEDAGVDCMKVASSSIPVSTMATSTPRQYTITAIPRTECPGHWTPWSGHVSYRVSWVTTDDEIAFTITGQITQTQWMGLDLSHDQQMGSSDIYITRWVRGTWVLEDRYSRGHSTPTVDVEQDVKNITYHEQGSLLTVTFARELQTVDQDDMNVTGCMYLLFAYGTVSNDTINYHSQNKIASRQRICFNACDSEPRVDDAIHVDCSTSDWIVTVDMNILRQVYPGAKVNDIYMGESFCKGVDHGGNLTFARGLMECLTNKETIGQSTVYTNELVYAVHDTARPYIIRRYKWVVPVQCDIYTNGNISGHIPIDNSSSTHQYSTTNSSDYSVHLLFYRDPNYLNTIPGNPLNVAVGTFVYVKVFTPMADLSVKMRVHTCYTIPSDTSPMSSKYYLIKNGCEVDTNTHITTQTAHATSFQFQNFESSASHTGIYVVCDVRFCASTDSSRHCTETCTPGNI